MSLFNESSRGRSPRGTLRYFVAGILALLVFASCTRQIDEGPHEYSAMRDLRWLNSLRLDVAEGDVTNILDDSFAPIEGHKGDFTFSTGIVRLSLPVDSGMLVLLEMRAVHDDHQHLPDPFRGAHNLIFYVVAFVSLQEGQDVKYVDHYIDEEIPIDGGGNVSQIRPRLESCRLVSIKWDGSDPRPAGFKELWADADTRIGRAVEVTGGHRPAIMDSVPWKLLCDMGIYVEPDNAMHRDLWWCEWDRAWTGVIEPSEDSGRKPVIYRIAEDGEFTMYSGVHAALDTYLASLVSSETLGTVLPKVSSLTWWKISETRAVVCAWDYKLSHQYRVAFQESRGRGSERIAPLSSNGNLPTHRVHDRIVMFLLDTSNPESVKPLDADTVPCPAQLQSAWIQPVSEGKWIVFTKAQSACAMEIESDRIKIEPLYRPLRSLASAYLADDISVRWQYSEQFKGESLNPDPRLGFSELWLAAASRSTTTAWSDGRSYFSGLVPSILVVRPEPPVDPRAVRFRSYPERFKQWQSSGWPGVELREFVLPAGSGSVGAMFPVTVGGYSGVIAISTYFGVGAIQPSDDWAYRVWLILPEIELVKRVQLTNRAIAFWRRRGWMASGTSPIRTDGFDYERDSMAGENWDPKKNRVFYSFGGVHHYRIMRLFSDSRKLE